MNAAYDDLCDHVRQTARWESINSLLNWDERTYLPPAAREYRADQISDLAKLIHRRQTDPRLGEWLQAADQAPDSSSTEKSCVLRRVRREYQKQQLLPATLVEELARCSVLGQQAWVEARRQSNFQILAPQLQRIVQLKREQADIWSTSSTRYDALLDEYEPEALTDDIQQTLGELRDELVPLVQAIQDAPRTAPRDLLRKPYPLAAQRSIGTWIAEQIGFDFQRGRLDETEHPFCTELGPHDCRILTRYDASYFSSAFYGVLHEAGHGLYEQGLPAELYGLPTGKYISLGIHESQSRLWENLVGRSQSFCEFLMPRLQQEFSEACAGRSHDDFYFAVNDVRPSLIRVEADEATYNLHILIRFEMELALVQGDLEVADLPDAWNSKYQQYLGIRPDSDAVGVLQDIHWSAGLIGYFPTYSLGNLYAAQFFAQADQDLGGLSVQFRRGEFRPLLDWLRDRIHRHGQVYAPAELVQRVTGRPLSHEPLIDHLKSKLFPLYGIT